MLLKVHDSVSDTGAAEVSHCLTLPFRLASIVVFLNCLVLLFHDFNLFKNYLNKLFKEAKEVYKKHFENF